MRQYSVGNLFAGVGGICLAFKQANCKILWANEIDKNACATHKINNLCSHLIEDDIKKIFKNDTSNIDILTAGFPCQPFSIAGHGKGFDDERGKLFFEFIRLLNRLKPKAYLLENVKTLSTHDNGKTFKKIQQQVLKTGYSFIPFVLNASKYTNIPQGRERIYIVGFKNEADFFYDKPIKENINTGIKCKLSQSFNIPKPTNKPPKSFRLFLDATTVNEQDKYNNTENHIHQRIIEAVKKDDTVYQYRRHYVRENKSNVCPTLTANMGGGGHNIPIVLDGKTPRRLSPKECFNLQGFPKSFKFPDIAKSQLYKQAGNSVVVPMVQKIAKEMVRVLNENN